LIQSEFAGLGASVWKRLGAAGWGGIG